MRPDELAPTPVRWWWLRPWSRNPLMRRSDRLEAALVVLAAVLILLAIPVAAAFGTATYTRLEHRTQALRAGVHQVPAVLLEDTHPAPDTLEASVRSTGTQDTARARWSTPHGHRTAQVPTEGPAKSGQTITISVDANGNLTGPIPSSRDTTVLAVSAAVGVWASAAGAVLLPTALARTLLARNRLRQWEQDWTQFDTPPR
ncbi:hypothetical protein ACH47B_29240 [Rhodococcus sp. NPDC019627]|uniref:Rv1733c family protein n=1 Tax=unclassified Rhodococcus (in: high G+C Gram-positive bacteria) TaxID=192944 RepID=UPI0033DDDFCD